MSAARRCGWVAVGAVLLGGCSDEEWIYRPRDAGRARLDAGVAMSDGAVGDRGVVTDVDVVTPGDVPTPRDVGMETDAGPMPTGLTVRAQGVATSGAASATVGTLRVSETGFEVGERGCVGTLCAVGGLVP